MGFADKALHFEQCSERARDHYLRQQFEQAADFYRKLAGVADDFPPKFPGRRIWGTRLEQRAEECRTMADYFNEPTAKAMMIRLADTYEKMAEAAEKVQGAE